MFESSIKCSMTFYLQFHVRHCHLALSLTVSFNISFSQAWSWDHLHLRPLLRGLGPWWHLWWRCEVRIWRAGVNLG